MKTNDLTGAVKAFQQSVTLEPDVSCLQPDVTFLSSFRSTCPQRCCEKRVYSEENLSSPANFHSTFEEALLQFVFLRKWL